MIFSFRFIAIRTEFEPSLKVPPDRRPRISFSRLAWLQIHNARPQMQAGRD